MLGWFSVNPILVLILGVETERYCRFERSTILDHLETIYGLILGHKLFSNSLNALKRSMSQVLDVRLQYGLLT